jgi:hypothetical protein
MHLLLPVIGQALTQARYQFSSGVLCGTTQPCTFLVRPSIPSWDLADQLHGYTGRLRLLVHIPTYLSVSDGLSRYCRKAGYLARYEP